MAPTNAHSAKQMPDDHTRMPSATTVAPVTIAAATGQVSECIRFDTVDFRHASSGDVLVSTSSASPIGLHPLVEIGWAHRQPIAADGFADRREHRREQHEERREQQDPVVRQERRLARHPRIQLVAGLQQRQAINHQPEAEEDDREIMKMVKTPPSHGSSPNAWTDWTIPSASCRSRRSSRITS